MTDLKEIKMDDVFRLRPLKNYQGKRAGYLVLDDNVFGRNYVGALDPRPQGGYLFVPNLHRYVPYLGKIVYGTNNAFKLLLPHLRNWRRGVC